MNIEITDDLFVNLPDRPSRTHHFFKRIIEKMHRTLPREQFFIKVMELFTEWPLELDGGLLRGQSPIHTRDLYVRVLRKLYKKYSLNQFFNECAVYMVGVTNPKKEHC